MTGLINIGAGLSQMGQAISDNALMVEKNSLDNQKLLLANELATGRETQLAGVQYGYQSKLAGQQQGFEQGLETQKETFAGGETAKEIASREKIAGEEIAANKANIQAQIGADHLTMNFDADTGAPEVTNLVTGKSTPLLGPDGKPMDIINTAMVPMVQATINSNNEQMRAENQTYTSELSSLNQQMKEAADSATAVTPEARMKAQAPYQARIDALSQQHKNVMDSLRSASARAAAALYTKGATPQDIKGASGPGGGNRPPISSFLKPPAGQNAAPAGNGPDAGLINSQTFGP